MFVWPCVSSVCTCVHSHCALPEGSNCHYINLPVQSCSKEEIVHRIQVFVDGHLEEWLQEVDPREFLAEYPKQAIELKVDCVRQME